MKKISFILGIAIVASLSLGQKGLAKDQIRVMEPIKYDGPGHVPDEIIVKFNPGAGRSEIAKINSKHGTTEIYTSPFAGFKRLKIPKGASAQKMVNIYSKNPNVEYAELNYIVYALSFPDDSYYSYQWHMDNSAYGGIGMNQAWALAEHDGAGVIVAVIDTGVAHYPIPDFDDLAETSFVDGYNFVSDNDDPTDDHGHGTHVTGTIAQSTNNGLGVAGVAYACSIMPVKVLNSSGNGTSDAVADGIMFAADNGAQVINMSLGSKYPSKTIEDAVAYAHDEKGVTIVCASGNNGYSNRILYPAGYDDYCIAVGATTYDEQIAYYSNGGSSLDLTAPGGNVYQDLNGDGYGDGVLQQTFNYGTWGYWFMQGTSMAAPHVSGVAALVISEGIASTPDDVRAVLQSTAEDKGAEGWDPQYGHGIVDAAAAVGAGGEPDTEPPVIADATGNTSGTTGEPVTISATITDNVGVTSATVHYMPIDGTQTTVLMTKGDSDVWNADVPVAPDKVGTITYYITAEDAAGNTARDPAASGTYSITVTDNDAPVADAGPDQTVNEETIVHFDGSSSSDNIGIVSYKWDIDASDGANFGNPDLTDQNPTLDDGYDDPGSYTVTLQVADEAGNTATDTLIVTVILYDDTPPSISNITGNISVTTGESENIVVTATDDVDPTLAKIFIDGDPSGIEMVEQPDNTFTYTYTAPIDSVAPHNYYVEVYDASNNSIQSATYTITVIDNDPPIAEAGPDQSVLVGETVTFDGSSSSDNIGIASYSWDFGDGATATATDPATSHTYTSEGVYTVTLTVTDAAGLTDTDTAIVTVSEVSEPTMHVGDLDGQSLKMSKGNWQASVTITVHDAGENPVYLAKVEGTFNQNGYVVTVTGTTDLYGTCTVKSGKLPNKKGKAKAIFTVTNITHGTLSLSYEPGDNHDPDDDSNGTIITISK